MLADPTLANFLKMKKFSVQKKLQVWDQSTNSIPHLYFFFEIKNFLISKKNTSVGSSAFQKNLQVSDQPTLVIFLTFFEKKIQVLDQVKLPKSQTKWTGLLSLE